MLSRIALLEQVLELGLYAAIGSQPAPLRLSLGTDVDESGVWSPDGLRVAWAGQWYNHRL